MKKTVSAGGVVINPAGEILITSQRGDSWSLPKGHVDPGETDIQAAYREIQEETGIQKDSLEYIDALGSYERHRIGRGGVGEDASELKEIRMFLFKAGEIDLRPTDPGNPEARWVSFDAALTMLTHPKDKEFFNSKIPAIKNALK